MYMLIPYVHFVAFLMKFGLLCFVSHCIVNTLNKLCCQNLFSGRFFALYDNFKVQIVLHKYILEHLMTVLGILCMV